MSRLTRELKRLASVLVIAATALAGHVPPAFAQESAAPDVIGTNTQAILSTTVTGFPSCLSWKPTGVCFFLYCTMFGCTIRTSIKISHYVPDAIVSTYNDPLNHPWTDFGKPVASALSGFGSSLLGSPLDASADEAREDKEMINVKAVDAVGNPLADLAAMASGSMEVSMPDSVPVPTPEELMKFPSEELPRIMALWATVPVDVGNELVEGARGTAMNPGGMLSGLTGMFGSFSSIMGSTQTDGLPTDGMGESIGGGGSGGTGGTLGGSGGSSGGFDTSGLQSMIKSLGGGDGGELFCPGGSRAFNIHYESDLDGWFWRTYLPLELLYPQSWIPWYGEVGNSPINTWGNVYPRTGELTQSHPAKASAVYAMRAYEIISRGAQPHIYKKMDTPGGFIYFERFADPKWQPVFPVPESGCMTFGEPDLVGPFSARDFKTSSTYGYIWNMWTRYECCRIRGAFLFSIP